MEKEKKTPKLKQAMKGKLDSFLTIIIPFVTTK